MAKLLTHMAMQQLINQVGLKVFITKLVERLELDFKRWDEFCHAARMVAEFPTGVIELMPIYDSLQYSFKYVNGHPGNPSHGLPSICAIGLLSDVTTGHPEVICDMSLLTAIRTACTSALVAKYAANSGASRIGIIGLGAQSEFQVLAHTPYFDLEQLSYFDIDDRATQKFANNMSSIFKNTRACQNAKEVVENSDLIITATSHQDQLGIIREEWIAPGCHIAAIGSDRPDKNEIYADLIRRSHVIVEYFQQTKNEGEIQKLGDSDQAFVSIHQLVSRQVEARHLPSDITLFDSVGYALEDFSALSLVNDLIQTHTNIGINEFLCELKDPKNLVNELSLSGF